MSKSPLVKERLRLGFKAKDIAEHTGVATPTQSNYELGKRYPDARYLAKVAELGFELNYVVTGKKHEALTGDEKLFIELFRTAPESVQGFIINGLNNKD